MNFNILGLFITLFNLVIIVNCGLVADTVNDVNVKTGEILQSVEYRQPAKKSEIFEIGKKNKNDPPPAEPEPQQQPGLVQNTLGGVSGKTGPLLGAVEYSRPAKTIAGIAAGDQPGLLQSTLANINRKLGELLQSIEMPTARRNEIFEIGKDAPPPQQQQQPGLVQNTLGGVSGKTGPLLGAVEYRRPAKKSEILGIASRFENVPAPPSPKPEPPPKPFIKKEIFQISKKDKNAPAATQAPDAQSGLVQNTLGGVSGKTGPVLGAVEYRRRPARKSEIFEIGKNAPPATQAPQPGLVQNTLGGVSGKTGPLLGAVEYRRRPIKKRAIFEIGKKVKSAPAPPPPAAEAEAESNPGLLSNTLNGLNAKLGSLLSVVDFSKKEQEPVALSKRDIDDVVKMVEAQTNIPSLKDI